MNLTEYLMEQWKKEPNYVREEYRNIPYVIHRAPMGYLQAFFPVVATWDMQYDWTHENYVKMLQEQIVVHKGINHMYVKGDDFEPDNGRGLNNIWIGFHCGHAGDLIPLMFPRPGDVYRTFYYVESEIKKAIDQYLDDHPFSGDHR